tara:strand:- start:184 stop:468 length:285 start_codon:yes stop_codon:yes gene_type:complete
MGTEEISDMIDGVINDTDETPIRQFISYAFSVYDLNTTDSFIDQYMHYFSGIPEEELRAGIAGHVARESMDPPIQTLVLARILKQECPSPEHLH